MSLERFNTTSGKSVLVSLDKIVTIETNGNGGCYLRLEGFTIEVTDEWQKVCKMIDKHQQKRRVHGETGI